MLLFVEILIPVSKARVERLMWGGVFEIVKNDVTV
jgi:hypothetical protein